jgi:hypothetical protein
VTYFLSVLLPQDFFVQPRSDTFRFNLQRQLLCKDSRRKDITIILELALTLDVIIFSEGVHHSRNEN